MDDLQFASFSPAGAGSSIALPARLCAIPSGLQKGPFAFEESPARVRLDCGNLGVGRNKGIAGQGIDMKIRELKESLRKHPEAHVRFQLPDGSLIVAHAHVTEAARVDKRFVDCGGTFREESLCRLQTWPGEDLDHRLNAKKLLKILEKAKPVLISEDLEIDVEHEIGYISQFPLERIEASDGEVVLRLSARHTACLAQDQCCPKPPEILSLKPVNFTLQPGR